MTAHAYSASGSGLRGSLPFADEDEFLKHDVDGADVMIYDTTESAVGIIVKSVIRCSLQSTTDESRRASTCLCLLCVDLLC